MLNVLCLNIIFVLNSSKNFAMNHFIKFKNIFTLVVFIILYFHVLSSVCILPEIFKNSRIISLLKKMKCERIK